MTAERESVGATHYEVLGVPGDADRQAIARAYRAAMRRLHPDAAEAVAADSADEIAAVQEAWRVLKDADARAAYDREASAQADVWSDLGWGVAVDAPDDEDSGTAPPSAWSDADSEDAPDAGDQVDPWRTPFAAGAVRIPVPPPPAGRPKRGMLDWILAVTAPVLIVAAAVMWFEWSDDSSASTQTPVPFSGFMVAMCLVTSVGMLAEGRSAQRDSQERAVSFGVGGMTGVFGLVLLVTADRHTALLGATEAGALLTLGFAVVRRVSMVRRAAADEQARIPRTTAPRSGTGSARRSARAARASRRARALSASTSHGASGPSTRPPARSPGGTFRAACRGARG